MLQYLSEIREDKSNVLYDFFMQSLSSICEEIDASNPTKHPYQKIFSANWRDIPETLKDIEMSNMQKLFELESSKVYTSTPYDRVVMTSPSRVHWTIYMGVLKSRLKYDTHLTSQLSTSAHKAYTPLTRLNQHPETNRQLSPLSSQHLQRTILDVIPSSIIMYMLQFCDTNTHQSVYQACRVLRHMVMNPASWQIVGAHYSNVQEYIPGSGGIQLRKHCPNVFASATSLCLSSDIIRPQNPYHYDKFTPCMTAYALDAVNIQEKCMFSRHLRVLDLSDWIVDLKTVGDASVFPQLTSLTMLACNLMDDGNETSGVEFQTLLNHPTLTFLRISLWASSAVLRSPGERGQQNMPNFEFLNTWKSIQKMCFKISPHMQHFAFYSPTLQLQFKIARNSCLHTLDVEHCKIESGLDNCATLTTLHCDIPRISCLQWNASLEEVYTLSPFFTQLSTCTKLTSLQLVNNVVPVCVLRHLSNLSTLELNLELVIY